jgi:hypothetical protein
MSGSGSGFVLGLLALLVAMTWLAYPEEVAGLLTVFGG